MKKQFEILNITRSNVLKAIEELSLEQLNTVPEGFKNNIIWNVGHLVVTQQLLCYKLSELEMYVDADSLEKYKKGTEVNFLVTQEEVNKIKEDLLKFPIKLETDYGNSIFQKFHEYTTSYNITLSNVDEAISFNNVHEGLHFGYIMAMKKLV